MEKCSFCVHRIKDTKNTARLEGRSLKTNEVKTACKHLVQPAPLLLVLNDPESDVTKAFKNDLGLTHC